MKMGEGTHEQQIAFENPPQGPWFRLLRSWAWVGSEEERAARERPGSDAMREGPAGEVEEPFGLGGTELAAMRY